MSLIGHEQRELQESDLHELTKRGPVPMIADAPGYHPSTIERHAIRSASSYAEYVASFRGHVVHCRHHGTFPDNSVGASGRKHR